MISWLKDKLFPNIVDKGVFGKGHSFLWFKQDNEQVGEDQLQSTVVFGTLAVSDGQQFQLIFLWSAKKNEEAVVDNDIIILENMRPLGFCLSNERLFIGYHHLSAGLKAIAKFHALSYIAKHNDFTQFQNKIVGIRDITWDSDGKWILVEETFRALAFRGIDRLLQRNPEKYHDHMQLKKFIAIMNNSYNNLRAVLEPRQPHAVICHGDLCRNNIMFRYDDSGRPTGALLFDVAMPKHGSPALDLSFFLYLNTNKGLRESSWHKLLDVYHSCLSMSVPKNVRVPSRSELDLEMASYAFFGFSCVSHFLIRMIDKNPMPISGYIEMSEEAKLEYQLKVGGDEGTELLADVIQHIVDMGYTDIL